MNATTILGTLGVLLSLVIVFAGFPHQVYTNWKKKSCEGMSPILIISAFFTYALWGSYAFTKPDHFLQISQTPGFFFSLVLVLQLILYKPLTKKKKTLLNELKMLEERNAEVGENNFRNVRISELKIALHLA